MYLSESLLAFLPERDSPQEHLMVYVIQTIVKG